MWLKLPSSEIDICAGQDAGQVGNNDAEKVSSTQVQAPSVDDLGGQAVARELGGLPVVASAAVPPGTVRVVLAADYTGPGSGLEGTPDSATADLASGNTDGSGDDAPPAPSPILTAGSNDPQCVN